MALDKTQHFPSLGLTLPPLWNKNINQMISKLSSSVLAEVCMSPLRASRNNVLISDFSDWKCMG